MKFGFKSKNNIKLCKILNLYQKSYKKYKQTNINKSMNCTLLTKESDIRTKIKDCIEKEINIENKLIKKSKVKFQ